MCLYKIYRYLNIFNNIKNNSQNNINNEYILMNDNEQNINVIYKRDEIKFYNIQNKESENLYPL